MAEKLLQHFTVDCLVSHHTFLSNLLPAGLKLGFYQAHQLPCLLQQRAQGGENQPQRDEGHVDTAKVQGCRDVILRQVPYVGALHAHDPRIVAQGPSQLAVSHVYGIDLSCPVLEHAVGEPTGGSTSINGQGTL